MAQPDNPWSPEHERKQDGTSETLYERKRHTESRDLREIKAGKESVFITPWKEKTITGDPTMKKEINKIVIASILVLGLFAGPAFAQTSGTTQPRQQMGGGMQSGMMGMQGQGMMGGNQGNWDGMGCNGMMGGAMMNKMTPGEQQDFMNQTTELRKEMMDLRFAYGEAMRNPATTPKDLANIEKNMLELRIKMMGKMQNLQTQ
ncbi:MAG: hypothetical protein ACI8ZB_005245 [Desulforhopalus sp.]